MGVCGTPNSAKAGCGYLVWGKSMDVPHTDHGHALQIGGLEPPPQAVLARGKGGGDGS